MTQVAAEGEYSFPPASGQVLLLIRFEETRETAWQGSGTDRCCELCQKDVGKVHVVTFWNGVDQTRRLVSCATFSDVRKSSHFFGQHSFETRDSGCQTQELSGLTVKCTTTRKGCDQIPVPSGRILIQKSDLTDCVSRPSLQRETYEPCCLTV